MTETYIPKTLEEAHQFLDLFLQDKEQFKNFQEDDVLAVSHMGLGRWIRNRWYLWWSEELYERAKKTTPDYPSTKPELVKYFNDLGIEHGDDMSGIIIISFYKKINNQVYDLDADVRKIKEFYLNNPDNQ